LLIFIFTVIYSTFKHINKCSYNSIATMLTIYSNAISYKFSNNFILLLNR
jgi:hypothetical protein